MYLLNDILKPLDFIKANLMPHKFTYTLLFSIADTQSNYFHSQPMVIFKSLLRSRKSLTFYALFCYNCHINLAIHAISTKIAVLESNHQSLEADRNQFMHIRP